MMNTTEDLCVQLSELVVRRARLTRQALDEDRPDYRDLIDEWIDAASDEIGRINAEIEDFEIAHTRRSRARGLNLSEY